ncbi:MAG: LemA family protein [Bacteroidales bacterium]|nr:LemA family protein [Bacteroidales bacterium]
MTGLIIVLALVFLLVLILISLYNRLVRLRNNRENAFADIDVQLRQRHDLIPQLVDAVKGYMKHERELLNEVTNARAAAMQAGSINEKIAAEARLTSALGGIQVAVEAYPDLKASQNFMQLQEEISDVENKLAAARRFFNAATKELNIAVQVFPSNIVAGMFAFHKEPMFELGDRRVQMEEPPKVSFE